jgi:hypothetical protein
MRLILLTTSLVLEFVTAALGQPVPQFEIGPVVRLDGVFVEGRASGGTAVAGVVTTFRISKTYGVEAELTQAWNRIERSYEGWFISYAEGPNATREEIERLAPILRRSLGYTPQLGGSAAFVARLERSPRINLTVRVGVSARRYVETSAYDVLSIPEGVDPARFGRDFARDFRDSSERGMRGGLLVGLDVSLAVTDHMSVAPEVRFVYGGPARIGYNHSELGLGARGVWRFR